VPDFLPLGLRCSPMIVSSFDGCARLMGWSHVIQIIRATKFESTDVLGNPTLARPIDLALT
jgi:hypothetical protein